MKTLKFYSRFDNCEFLIMKKVAIFFFLLICYTSIYAQEPPIISFDNIDVNWEYISKDTTYVQVDEFSSPYWGFYFLDYEIKGNDLYFLESVFSQSPNGGFEGSLLHKLDIATGEQKWVNHNSSYTGNIFREGFGNSSLIVSNEGDVTLIGNRSLDTLFTSFSLFGFHSKPIERTIDRNTGELISKKESSENTMEYYNFYTFSNRIIHTKSKGYLCFSPIIFDDNNVVQNSLEFRRLDDSLNIDPDPFYALNTPYPVPSNQLTRPTFHKFIGEDKMAILFANSDPVDNTYKNITLSWLDFSQDVDNIERRSIDVSDQLPVPENAQNETIFIIGQGEDIFLEQEFYDENGDKYNWLSWYHNMEWSGRIPFMVNEEGIHYDQIEFIKSEDDKAYFIARAGNEFDIILWERGEEEFNIIKTLAPEVTTTDFLRIYFKYGSVFTLPDDKMMIAFGVEKLNQFGRGTNFSYYYNIDLEQLSIPTSTEDITENEALTIYPNPNSGIFSVNTASESCGALSIYNAQGEKVIAQQPIRKENSIDLSDQPNGIYLIKLATCEGAMKESKVVVYK